MLWSVSSALGSGAARPSGFFVRLVGFKGIGGLPTRLTGGGTLDVCVLGLRSGVGGAVLTPSDAAFGAVLFWSRALIRASKAGVGARLGGLGLSFGGESVPLLEVSNAGNAV